MYGGFCSPNPIPNARNTPWLGQALHNIIFCFLTYFVFFICALKLPSSPFTNYYKMYKPPPEGAHGALYKKNAHVKNLHYLLKNTVTPPPRKKKNIYLYI